VAIQKLQVRIKALKNKIHTILPEDSRQLREADMYLKALAGIIEPAELCEVLDHAPPGIFDRRSWAYWNLKCGREPVPPLPTRTGLQ